MANLAIRGHETRGKEVIELLEMLGGANEKKLMGCCEDKCYWFGTNERIIVTVHPLTNWTVFTLEEFLERFPYKVGDKVLYHQTYAVVNAIKWDGREIVYTVECNKELWETTACFLEPYKEEIMEDNNNFILTGKINTIIFQEQNYEDKVELVLGDNFEVKVEDGKTYVVRKKPKYPKSYEECYKFLNRGQEDDVVLGYKEFLLERFQELLVCRDAYWKIAGDWKPEYKEGVNNNYYTIHTFNNKITLSATSHRNAILAFPTEEMRNQFFENFKELIESCKDLL